MTRGSNLRDVWVVTDGRPGNEGPALALARAMEAHGWAPAEIRRATPRRGPARLPAMAWAAIPPRVGGWPFSALEDAGAALSRPWPELVISAGRRSAPVAAAMRRLSGGATRAVQILNPGMRLSDFDAVVVPSHDRLKAPNVVETLGSLSRVTPALAAAEASLWSAALARLPQPRLAVLVGGPSRSARWSPTMTLHLVEALEQATAAGWGIMATLSRRSPEGLNLALRRAAPRAFIWDGAGANPYPGILGLASAALVTADSVNMASEAASAGVPVHVLGLADVSAKLARFHEQLALAGASREWDGRLLTWPVRPLAQAEAAAAVLAERLG
ncbi:mitochondrial fission ELM1 family protein [Albimonas sp. CAU 1670]|uniref:mitochondrial fission ELM1 family protein n=1 Tax=Albimonas sp. CAU 1670 TaxID=3032599 RepID=UPI0023DBEF89|nr:mitochondrial fission ELM1 family protein [Albimonas sp. CAU 1670]MDF2234916.1 mitochondrial fission ELM1 family protein [Albimonas sp. CAU 1670]